MLNSFRATGNFSSWIKFSLPIRRDHFSGSEAAFPLNEDVFYVEEGCNLPHSSENMHDFK